MVDTIIQSIRPKNNTLLNRALFWDRKYHALINDDNSSERTQEIAFNKFIDYFDELPKYEQKAARPKYKKLFGYDSF